ncbi:MAG: ABC transporter ATP-binding protein [Betaproteobacteria bacterium]|nr:ABC transporter ATP-binding protein [Betaproteobacteria bacterium]
MTEAAVLEVRDLTVEFRSRGAWHPAVRGVDFAIAPNETLAVVGESGSGKSVTALAVMGLVPAPSGRISAGSSIRLDGRELVGLPDKALDKVRGDRVAMIFQEPMTALNPTMTVGAQVAESVRTHRGLGAAASWKEAQRALDLVKVPSAAKRMGDYPHQFSGGMRQRVMIAMALACQPAVLLADEPTTALDVTIQAQVLSLIEDLKREYGLGVLFITHNLGVVALIADRVAVMYAGEIVETATVAALFEAPRHPYTEALLASMPRVDRDIGALEPIQGNVPSIRDIGAGCTFAPRCPLATQQCRTERPALVATGEARAVRCWVRGGTA